MAELDAALNVFSAAIERLERNVNAAAARREGADDLSSALDSERRRSEQLEAAAREASRELAAAMETVISLKRRGAAK